jgi:hypothetical protein
VCFENGEEKVYDVGQLFERWGAFRALSITEGLFKQVKVDVGGYGVSWNDDLDLSCDELYRGGRNLVQTTGPRCSE